MNSAEAVSLVVAERGSHWTSWFEQCRADGNRVVAVVQRGGESPSGLALRVRQRVEQLQASGNTVDFAVLVGGARCTRDVIASRAAAIRGITSNMVRAGNGRVVLDAGTRTGTAHHAMAALVDAVSGQVRRTGVSITDGSRRERPLPLEQVA